MQLCAVAFGNQTHHGDHFALWAHVKCLCCTPEAHMMLCVSYTSMEKHCFHCFFFFPLLPQQLSTYRLSFMCWIREGSIQGLSHYFLLRW